jgi:hypothetical protein
MNRGFKRQPRDIKENRGILSYLYLLKAFPIAIISLAVEQAQVKTKQINSRFRAS